VPAGRLRWARRSRIACSYVAGLVTGAFNGKALSGTFDPRTRKSTVNVSLDRWFPAKTKSRLAYLAPVLDECRPAFGLTVADMSGRLGAFARDGKRGGRSGVL
jgi:hypothetical protein